MSTAIPTTFRGVRYRSRLEARWAALFDTLGWAAEYEPLDLDGYVPDFVVRRAHDVLLVEVKPALGVAEMGDAAAKIDRSGWPVSRPAFVVGAVWNPTGMGASPLPVAGAMRQATPDGGHLWAEALWGWCDACSTTAVHHLGVGCPHCGAGPLSPPPDLESMWKAAGNVVQWRGRRAA